MRKILLPLFSVFLFFACSTSNDDDGLPQSTQEDLKEAIIGKWDVENPNLINSAIEKQGDIRCRIFTLIFKSDGTFIIDHQDGVTTGEFTVVSASSISLGGAGSIGNISFVGTSLVFFIELNGVCSIAAQSIRDMDYAVGDCFSFLNCYMETFWQSTEEESTAFLFFENFRKYFNRWEYFDTHRCQETTNNSDATYVLFQNHKNELKFIREKDGNRRIYTYRKGEEGNLEEEIETGGELETRTYRPTARGSMDVLSNYWMCGERTFVPDDVFEGLLIRLGYDDVMDDYVLTENINSIEQLYISDNHNYPNGEYIENLIGLEAFTAVTNLDVQVSNLAEIDLTGNINLERLFLGSPALTSLDLSENVNLNSLYFEFANIQSLDLSKNTELRAVELQLMPLPLLDISDNPKLEMLTIEGSGFKELIAIENPILWHLNLGNNEMEQVNVELFPNLIELILDDNNLSVLDVSTLRSLENLDVGENKFSILDVSANLNLYELSAGGNPNLSCIQIAQVHLDWMEEENPRMFWGKDENTTYSLDCE